MDAKDREIKQLRREVALLLDMVARYIPEGMAEPQVERFNQWRRDHETIRKIWPGWGG